MLRASTKLNITYESLQFNRTYIECAIILVRKLSGSFYWRISINIFTLCECRVLRFFSDFLTFSTLNQAGNVESMGGAVGASFKWYDFVYFIDTLLSTLLF